MKKSLNYDFNAIEEMKKQLLFSESFINKEYLIKVKGEGYNMLVGVAGMLALIGAERANKFITRANKCAGDVCTCQVYGRDMRVSFYIH